MSEENGLGGLKFREGTVHILQETKKRKSARFMDLEGLTNPRTKRKYSPNTLSSRLKELEKHGLIRETIVKSDKGRIISYIITEKGDRFLGIVNDAENLLKSKS